MRLNRSRAFLPGGIAAQEGIFRTWHMQRYANAAMQSYLSEKDGQMALRLQLY